MTRRLTLAAALLALIGVVLGVAPAVLAAPGDYDSDGNQVIDRKEAVAALGDYLAGNIAKDEVLEVIIHYLSGSRVGPQGLQLQMPRWLD